MKEIVAKEMKALRDELARLKNCQMTFQTVPITTTGLILAFGLRSSEMSLLKYISLFPIIIILPSLLIFFDKATSITRITGYIRLLENFLIKDIYEKYIGFDNSLREWRKKVDDPQFQKDIKQSMQNENISIFRHAYWLISFIIYNSLSLICLLFSLFFYYKFPEKQGTQLIYLFSIIFAFIVVIVFITLSWHRVLMLTRGRFSYNKREITWKKILRVE